MSLDFGVRVVDQVFGKWKVQDLDTSARQIPHPACCLAVFAYLSVCKFYVGCFTVLAMELCIVDHR